MSQELASVEADVMRRGRAHAVTVPLQSQLPFPDGGDDRAAAAPPPNVSFLWRSKIRARMRLARGPPHEWGGDRGSAGPHSKPLPPAVHLLFIPVPHPLAGEGRDHDVEEKQRRDEYDDESHEEEEEEDDDNDDDDAPL